MNRKHTFACAGGEAYISLLVDTSKLTEEKAKEINKFWSSSDSRAMDHGSHYLAVVHMYAVEILQLMAFNNFKDESWAEEQFDWDIPGKGVEGFEPLADVGIRIVEADNLFLTDMVIAVDTD